MNLFISHSSRNANYGNALVELLIGIGISADDIIFSSNDAFGIPIGQNIFNWLRTKISEKPYVLYLLSPEYYKSVACLNEMGAAWIIESSHTMIFTPNFDLRSYDFQNGALDPREIGFYINNENKLLAFIESLKTSFSITNNSVLINQKVKQFISVIKPFFQIETSLSKNASEVNEKQVSIANIEMQPIIKKETITNRIISVSPNRSRFYSDLINDKLKDEELLLAKYIIDTDKFKLGTGWQESNEISNIKAWEDVHELSNVLSNSYNGTIRRLDMKKLTEVSAFTSFGNPKEISFVDEFKHELLDPSDELNEKLKEVIEKHKRNESLDF
ncbi:toll/interleukin-1 receptor domain-containing protein [Mucilaginibacter jinjuensis]|uniref:Toll/interleukin-1 receptor domain-containing protein n=1 Tax=Mucilaginibacter jinjuensis TaxID=1176721 RepID=A0ABY7T9R3_9SPHI|nr:toll/interleukin-1 receptor domain-containing protein [Mucilaginibacter jinjuensis]WCT13091.1 toll/interleukin-1 receptor domain-containing protein [Mucilaginibacter jinjuensis]